MKSKREFHSNLQNLTVKQLKKMFNYVDSTRQKNFSSPVNFVHCTTIVGIHLKFYKMTYILNEKKIQSVENS